MMANSYALPVKQALQFLSRTCSVFREEDSEYAPTPGQFTVAQHVAHVAQTIDWFMEWPAEALYNVGASQVQLGQRDAARATLERFVSLDASGLYSLVVTTVQPMARNSAAAPAQKLHFTVAGISPGAATLLTPNCSSSQGKIAATTAPAPMKAVCTA